MGESRTVLNLVSDILAFLTATSLGLLVGAMLTGGLVLLPYWRSLLPADFLAWFATNGQQLYSFYAPLTQTALLLAIAAAITSVLLGSSNRWLAILAAILAVAVSATYFLYFQKANASFAAATIDANDVPVELARYAVWQWVRIVLGFVGFAAALLALRRPI